MRQLYMQPLEGPMPAPLRRTKRSPHSARRASKTYRLTPSKLAAARRILGVATATEAIEIALDMVFRQELLDGTRAMLGVRLTPPDERRV
jgi:hypothetical protein